MIPRILHTVWLGSELPEWAARHLDLFREHNFGWDVRLYTEWPAPGMPADFRKIGRSCYQYCQMADLIYVWALATIGGVVLDLDHVVRRSFEPLRTYEAFTTRHSDRDLRLTNGIMGGVKGGAFTRALQWVLSHSPPQPKVPRCHYGPDLMTRLFDPPPDDLAILPWAWFYPFGCAEKKRALQWAEAPPAQREKLLTEISDRFGDELAGPYTVHLWGVAGSSQAEVAHAPDPGV